MTSLNGKNLRTCVCPNPRNSQPCNLSNIAFDDVENIFERCKRILGQYWLKPKWPIQFGVCQKCKSETIDVLLTFYFSNKAPFLA